MKIPMAAIPGTLPAPSSSAAAEASSGWFDGWTWLQWSLLALCVLLLAVLAYVAVRVIRHKLKMRRMVGTLREDLLLRRELAAMAAGKDRKSQQKEQFLRMESIRMDVAAACETLKANGIDPRRTGAWLLLGEPGSGKSRLMESGGLEYPAGLNDFSRAAEATSTLNLWITGNGAVWDIGGRLFLGRWGGRLDNEWQFFLNEFRKVYRRTLPNGVVLTVPADALLLDSPELRDRKIALIAEELRAMAWETGVFCPVWLIVTKCDRIDGFSEFFSLLDDEDCGEMLGWENRSPGNVFDQSVCDADFDRLVGKLEALRSSQALNESVWARTEKGEKRADMVNPVYLFPERFASLKENLGRYAAGVFAHVRSKQGGRGVFQFQGCWFMAVLDKPVVAMERLVFEKGGEGVKTEVVPEGETEISSIVSGGRLDTSGIVSVREKIVSVASPRHYFSSRLLRENVTQAVERCDYTDEAVNRIRRPYWITAAVLLGLAVPLVVWSAFSKPSLAALAVRDLAFWSDTRRLFEDGSIGSAPLLEARGGSQVPLLNEKMGFMECSRREYLDSLRNMAALSARVPLWWRPAAFLVDGEKSGRLLKTSKDFIAKAAVVNMLMKPAADASRTVLEYRVSGRSGKREEWKRDDTRMLSTLLRMTRYGILLMQGREVKDDIDYAPLIRLDDTPSLDSAVKSLWMSSVAGNESFGAMTALNGYLRPVSMEAASAIDKGVALFEDGVREMDIYPDLQYGVMWEALHGLKRLNALRESMRRVEDDFSQAVARDDYASMKSDIAAWKRMFSEAESVALGISGAEKKLGIEGEPSLRVCADAVRQSLISKLLEDQEEFDVMAEDLGESMNAEFLRGRIQRLHRTISEAFPRMAQDYAMVTDALCLFWDRSAKTPHEKRPWEAFMEYARELNGLFSYPLQAGSPDETFQRRIARVNDAREQYGVRVASLLKRGENVFDTACWERNWKILESQVVRTWVSEAPHNKAELAAYFGKGDGRRQLPAMPFTRAANTCSDPVFAPEAADRRISDLESLNAFVHERFKPSGAHQDEEVLSGIRSLETAIDYYLRDYVVYWTEQIPAKYKIQGIRTWPQFVESGDILRSCDVAGILQEVNRLMLDALEISCLKDREKYPGVAVKRANIAQAQKDLTADVMRKFMISAEFIGKMDPEPAKAWNALSSMEIEDLFSSYWAAWYPRTDRTTFLWWNNYLETGMRLLKDEAARSLRESVQGCLPFAAMFPLCNTAYRSRNAVLSRYAIEEIEERLASLGNLPDEEKQKKTAAQARALNIPGDIGELKLPMARSRIEAWERIGGVIDLLANPEMPLSCELVLPPSPVRKSSVDGEKGMPRVVPAGRRFPYCRIKRGGEDLTPLFMVNKDARKEIPLSSTPLPADAADLEFQFFQYSNSGTPDSVLRLEGAWSPVNLYLRQGTKLSDDRKTAYVPLVFQDREGYSCLFWVGLKFNRPMIAPGLWPGASVFETASVPGTADMPRAEKSLRQAIRSVFLTKHGAARQPKPEERRRLRREVADLLAAGYGLAFEVVTPCAAECPDGARARAAAVYPYFSVGDEMTGTSKMRALPDVTASAEKPVPGWKPLNVRLYRNSGDEYPALYVARSESLLDYVIAHAEAYSPLTGYMTIPVSGTDGRENVTYFIYLRPVMVAAPDDGLAPEASSSPLISYPVAEPVYSDANPAD